MTDLVIRNARLWGRPESGPVDVAVTGGRIHAIEPEWTDSDSPALDAEGRWMLPGLWDEHVHSNLWAISRRRLDLSSVSSAAEAVRRVAEAVIGSNDDVFIAVNYRDALWPDRLSLSALDAVSGERPVVLISGDVHACWLNSAAVRRFSVTEHADGRIAEDEAFRVQQLANVVDDATLDTWIRDAVGNAAARGVVGIVDLEMRDTAHDWVRRSTRGELPIRVEASVYTQHLDAAIREGRATGLVLDDRGLVSAGYFKCITDGSLGTQTAWCSHPYPDGSHGGANVDYADLAGLVQRAATAGIVPTIHAIGDLAVHEVLNMFERVGVNGRMEHAQQVLAADVVRFAELGVVASVQPEHAMDDRDAADTLWADALDGAYLLRSFWDAGARLAFGSDAPVAPLDPWQAIASAVWRTRGDREPWRAFESLTIEQAVLASSRYAQLELGAPADLILVDANPARATAAELRTLPVAATIVAGEPVHLDGVRLR
ncbi:MAG TPA: amidohydrolase family protein [Microbacteriaceae bacterium]|nr:amidohydrolase family protein [Microbacteriaceae bacterium]